MDEIIITIMKYLFNKEAHVHTLDGVALTGTSSIGNVLAKPLTWWASGLACEKFGWLNPKKNTPEAVQNALEEGFKRIKALTLVAFGKLLTEAYYAHSKVLKEKAEAGTDLHAELEHWVKSQMGKVPERADYDEKIKPYIEWSKASVKQYVASEAHCFDETLFVGGITDAVAEMNDGKLAVIDFKSSKEAYPTQFIQCSGYAIQIDKNGLFSEDGEHSKKLDKKIDALIVVPFGAEKIAPDIRFNVEDYKTGFRQAVGLYRLLGLDQKIKENAK